VSLDREQRKLPGTVTAPLQRGNLRYSLQKA